MALQKEFVNESGIVADFWIITSFSMIRNKDVFEYKIILDLYQDRNSFNSNFASLARRCLHRTSDIEMTLTELYTLAKQPELIKEYYKMPDNSEAFNFVDQNFFTNAKDLV